jgi:Peptidase family S41
MKRFAIALAVLLALAAPAQAQPAYSSAAWLQDLEQLRDAMSAGYANLEWQAQRGLDLPALYARTQSRIEAAQDDYAARRAIERFLTAFGDGHLEVHWPVASATGSAKADGASQPLCSRLGYFDIHDDGGPALRLPGARPVGAPNAHLKAALVSVGGRTLAVLRVGTFSQQGIPDICEQIAARRGLTAASPCDDSCRNAFGQAAEAAFIDEMAQQLQVLAVVHPDALLIDIFGNGGGDQSSLALARMVTAKPLKRPRGGGVMSAAWAKELASREADAAKALASATAPDRPALQRFDAALSQAHGEALKSCDRSPLWSGRPIGCTALVPEPLFESFWSTVPEPGDPIAHARTVWSGPVMVLVNGDSASSSEWFAAMLQDSHAATTLGSPTSGAGCGHVTDAPPVKLARSGGAVSMPDCWRLRANGENEVGGVEPDVLIGFRSHDSLSEATARLAHSLPQALTDAAKP